MTIYTAAITTASSDVLGDFCDVSVIENVLHGYTLDSEGNETPDYGLSDKYALEPIDLPVRTDDDDKLIRVEGAAEKILAGKGWRVDGEWAVADNALYVPVSRA